MARTDNYTGRLRVSGELSVTNAVNLGYTGTIHRPRVAIKTANYSVALADSGGYLVANNSGQIIYFNLPAVNTCNGRVWSFFTANTGKFHIVGDTNVIVDDFGAVQKAINFGRGAEGEGCTIVATGVKYYTAGLMQSNATYGFGYFDG